MSKKSVSEAVLEFFKTSLKGLSSICSLLVVAVIIVFSVLLFQDYSSIAKSITIHKQLTLDISRQWFEHMNFEACKGLYLDVGTNVGTQIRKLYQPESFPGAKSVEQFHSIFHGVSLSDVCTFGFEPNPEHKAWLEKVQDSLQCQGYNVKIFTETAVHTENGNMTFYRDLKTPERYKEWAASLTNWQNNSQDAEVTVQTIDLACFLHNLFVSHILPRKIPVLMKLDVEGAEYGILEKMLSAGVMCGIQITIEWHDRMAMPDINPTKIRELVHLYENVNSCNFRIIGGDDESYQVNSTNIPLPKCILA